MGHTGVGWVMQWWGGSCRGGVGGSCRGWGGVGVGHVGGVGHCRSGCGSDLAEVLDSPPPVGHYKGKHDYKMHIYHDHKKFFTLQPQNKGLGTSRGQIHVLPMTWGGWRHWGPLSVDMRPYGCFIPLI